MLQKKRRRRHEGKETSRQMQRLEIRDQKELKGAEVVDEAGPI